MGDNGPNNHQDHQEPGQTQHSPALKAACRRFRFLRAFEFLLLFSYETLTEQALQIVNCINVGECGHVLAQYPEVACPDTSVYIPLLVAAVLILVYAVVFPVWLFWFLWKTKNNENDDQSGAHADTMSTNEQVLDPSGTKPTHNDIIKQRAKYGVFFDQFRPQFWWWEVQVSELITVCSIIFEFVPRLQIHTLFSPQ